MFKNLVLNTLFLILVVVLIAGCATPTQKGAGIGALIGAGTGAIVGHQSGHDVEGALIGGAVGAAGGALVGNTMATKFCPTCGSEHTKDVEFCPKDGTKLEFKK